MSNPTTSDQRSVGRFSVESPVSYESFPLAPAAGEITEAAQTLRARMAARHNQKARGLDRPRYGPAGAF
jgi:hypothetical protein